MCIRGVRQKRKHGRHFGDVFNCSLARGCCRVLKASIAVTYIFIKTERNQAMKNRNFNALLFLSPQQIIVASDRGRKDFSNLNTLIESIEKLGLIHPCVVTKSDIEDKYHLIAGERRYRSMCILVWKTLPCTDRDDLSILERKEVELEENLRRTNLIWSEEIELYRQIDDIKKQIYGGGIPGSSEKGWTTKDTAESLGLKKSNVYKQVQFARFLNANPEYREEIKNLPLNTAMKKVEMLKLAEQNKRLLTQGLINVSADLRLGDCIDLIKDIPDNSIDLLLTDIPYGIDAVSLVLKGKEGHGSAAYKGMISDSDNLTKEQITGILEKLLPELQRVLKPSAHFYIFFSFKVYIPLFTLLRKNDFLVFDRPIIWNKGRTTTIFKGYEFMACYEPIMYGCVPPKEKRYMLGGKLIIEYSIIDSKAKLHPFEKPQELLQNLIRQSTNIGDMILDPFSGSASTLIAAKELNRNCIGFEINTDNYHRSLKRLEDRCSKEDMAHVMQK